MQLKTKTSQIVLYDHRNNCVKLWKGYCFHEDEFPNHPLAIYSRKPGEWHILERRTGCTIDKPSVKYHTRKEALEAVEDQYTMLLKLIQEQPGIYEKAVKRFKEAKERNESNGRKSDRG